MCRKRPNDRDAIATCNQKQAFPYRGRAVIAGTHFTPVHGIAQIFQSADPATECRSFSRGIRLAIDKWSPCLEFLDIFETDNSWPDQLGPFDHYPGQRSYFFADRFTAFRFREMFAVMNDNAIGNVRFIFFNRNIEYDCFCLIL